MRRRWLMVEGIASIQPRTFSQFRPLNVRIASFSTEHDAKSSLERAAKLKALFGVTAANTGRKPTGVLIKESTEVSKVTNTAISGAEVGKNIAEKGTSEVEKNACTTDSKGSAERTWLDSGYIEYMDNQRDKGWKS